MDKQVFSESKNLKIYVIIRAQDWQLNIFHIKCHTLVLGHTFKNFKFVFNQKCMHPMFIAVLQ